MSPPLPVHSVHTRQRENGTRRRKVRIYAATSEPSSRQRKMCSATGRQRIRRPFQGNTADIRRKFLVSKPSANLQGGKTATQKYRQHQPVRAYRDERRRPTEHPPLCQPQEEAENPPVGCRFSHYLYLTYRACGHRLRLSVKSFPMYQSAANFRTPASQHGVVSQSATAFSGVSATCHIDLCSVRMKRSSAARSSCASNGSK